MINVTIPTPNKTLNKDEISSLPDQQMGIYLLYDGDSNLIYIGKAVDLKKRLTVHLRSYDPASAKFAHLIHYIACIYLSCPVEMDIYETFMINELKPSWNTTKVYLYDSKPILERKKQALLTEERKELWVKEKDEQFEEKLEHSFKTFKL